jgi:hypothetical protein
MSTVTLMIVEDSLRHCMCSSFLKCFFFFCVYFNSICYNTFQLYVCIRVNCLYAHALTIFMKDAR